MADIFENAFSRRHYLTFSMSVGRSSSRFFTNSFHSMDTFPPIP
jgi:hypothetical protein